MAACLTCVLVRGKGPVWLELRGERAGNEGRERGQGLWRTLQALESTLAFLWVKQEKG